MRQFLPSAPYLMLLAGSLIMMLGVLKQSAELNLNRNISAQKSKRSKPEYLRREWFGYQTQVMQSAVRTKQTLFAR